MPAVGPLVDFGALPAAFSEFRRGFRVQRGVVFALMLRETRTRYSESALGYGWALIDPLIELVVLWLMFTFLRQRQVPIDAPLPVFLVTGIVPFGLWRASVSQGASAVRSNLPLLIYPQVTVADCIIARVLLEGATTLIVMQIFIVFLILLYGETLSDFYDEPFNLFTAWMTLLLFSLGIVLPERGADAAVPALADHLLLLEPAAMDDLGHLLHAGLAADQLPGVRGLQSAGAPARMVPLGRAADVRE